MSITAKSTGRIFIDFVVVFVLSWAGYFFFTKLLRTEFAIAFAFGGLLIAYALPYCVAIGCALIALLMGRWGALTGSILFGVTLALVTPSTEAADALMAATLEDEAAQTLKNDQRNFLPLQRDTQIIAVDGRGACDTICIQILAQGNDTFVTRRLAMLEAWTSYSRLDGSACLEPANRRNYLAFLEAGYVDICASEKKVELPPDGILIIANDNMPHMARNVVSGSFSGKVFEAYERNGEAKRLLGRWISGSVTARSGKHSFPTRAKVQKVGADFAPADFFAALLQQPIVPGKITGKAPLRELLKPLSVLAGDEDLRRNALVVIREATRDASTEEMKAAVPFLSAMLDDVRVESKIAALTVLEAASGKLTMDFAKPKIIAALESNDSNVIDAAIHSIYAFPREERPFAEEALIDLAFREVPKGKVLPVARSAAKYFSNRHVPFAADIREAAKAQLNSGQVISDGRAAFLLLIVGRKNQEPHEQLFNYVLSLKGPNFVSAVVAVHEFEWREIEGNGTDQWTTQEVQSLLPRADDVPIERFHDFIYPFLQYRSYDSVDTLLYDAIDRRIDSLKSDAATYNKFISILKNLRDGVGK
jgi:hypothetical protein